MKKLLLSLAAGFYLLAPSAMAETITLDVQNATDITGTEVPERPAGTTSDKDTGEARHIQPLESLKIDAYSFVFTTTSTNANQQPAYYYPMSTSPDKPNTLRVYAGTTVTMTAPTGCTITKIDFAGSNAGKDLTVTVDTGTATAVQSNKFSWTGESSVIAFTFDKTYRINTMEVAYTQGGDVKPAAEAPTFSREAGYFTEPFALSLSAAQGAKIYYTLDGTNPTEASDLYADPIAISKTTTVKAIAVEEGKRNSSVASATYTLEVSYSTLKEFMEAGLANTKEAVKYSGKATVVYQNGKYLFLQDETAPLLAYGQLTQSYKPGDVITGFAGKMTVYNNLNELNVDDATFAAPVESVAAPQPVKMDVEEITAADQNKYVLIENVTLSATTDPDTEKTSYRLTDVKDADIIAYPRFSDVEFPEADKAYNVVGLVSVFKEDLQIFPVSFSDVTGVESIEIDSAEAAYYNLQGQRVAAPAKGELLIKVQGAKATKVIF